MATVVRFEVEFAGQEGEDATSVFLHAMLAHYRGSGPRLCLFIPCADSGDDHEMEVEMEMEMEDGDIVTVEMDLTMLRPVFCRSDLVSLHVRVLQVLLSFLLSFFLSVFVCLFPCHRVVVSSCHHFDQSRHLIEVSESESTTSLAKFNAQASPDLERFQLYPAPAAAASASMPPEKKALMKSLAALDERKPKRPRLAKTAKRRVAKHVQYPWMVLCVSVAKRKTRGYENEIEP